MLAVHWVTIPVGWSLAVIVSILGIFAAVSRIVPEPADRPRQST
jgi:hypothetical protein